MQTTFLVAPARHELGQALDASSGRNGKTAFGGRRISTGPNAMAL